MHRFLKKIWRECLTEEGTVNPRIVATGALSPDSEKLLHETIRKVGDDIESLRFNTAISQMMILMNALQKESSLPRAAMLDVLRLLAPFAPHLAEELWARLGQTGSVMSANWPTFDASKLIASFITIVIQVNGKHRGDISVAAGTSDAELVLLASAHPRVIPHIVGKPIKRTIHVKGRLINLLV